MPDNGAEKNNHELPIIPAKTAIAAFRDAGYRNTASALAELIDNSIEANADTVQVITFEESVPPVGYSTRTVNKIVKIAVYDDGKGMGKDVLAIALQFGNGTRLESRKGMGRFGIGLPNASVSQCSRVEVYSWQNNECYSTYLDVDEIKQNKSQFTNAVKKCLIPKDILAHIEGKIGESGTLIVWSKCDRLDIARTSTLFRAMEKDLCRIYRHYLDNDISYGRKVDIKLISTVNPRSIQTLKANDPLYLLTPNNLPGYENESTNEPFGNPDEPIKIEIEYEPGKTSTVEMRFSCAKPETQALGGSTLIGKHYKANIGISFVRACREIDFGAFGFFDATDTRERWWGCEVRFEPVLDELFGVTNNKQHVRGISYLDRDELEDTYGPNYQEVLNDDKKLFLRLSLSQKFHLNHKNMMENIRQRNSSEKNPMKPDIGPIIGTDFIKKTKQPKTSATVKADGKSPAEIEDEVKKDVMLDLPQNGVGLSSAQIDSIVSQKLVLKIDKQFETWPGEQFFTIKTRGNTVVIVINKRHEFYQDLYEPISKLPDQKFITTLDLLMLAYAEAESEHFGSDAVLESIRSKWGYYLKGFLVEHKGRL
jgi:hypothetical protein